MYESFVGDFEVFLNLSIKFHIFFIVSGMISVSAYSMDVSTQRRHG